MRGIFFVEMFSLYAQIVFCRRSSQAVLSPATDAVYMSILLQRSTVVPFCPKRAAMYLWLKMGETHCLLPFLPTLPCNVQHIVCQRKILGSI